MWLITGPFDSATADVITTKTKLLKTGRKISLGRKDKHLMVNNKKISRDHCEFTVGSYTEDKVSDPTFVPTLEIYNAKEKPISIDRDGLPVIVNPSSASELKSGDKINIVVGITVQVEWRSIACFHPPARSIPVISNQDCASLGINMLTSPTALATHHLTPKYELSVLLVTSLLSATQLVKAEWLQELIRLGTTSDDSHPLKLAPLELTFTPPPESRYRPVFSPALTPSLKYFKHWEPNEERLHFLKGYRFVLLSDAEGHIDHDIRDLVIRGDAEYEGFPLSNGEAKWRQMLAKAKRKVDEAGLKVAIVARQHVVQAAVGADKWQQMATEAQSLSLPLISAETLMNAVINTNVAFINEGSSIEGDALAENESLLPNTHPNGPSLPLAREKAPSERDNVRRKSPSPSPPPTILGLAVPPPPSKNLIRRSKPSSRTGRTEEHVTSDFKDEPKAENLGYSLPPPSLMTRATRLKRRSPAPSGPVDELVLEAERSQEPPLKKFKALFDANDPAKMVVDSGSLPDGHDTAMGESVGLTQGGESLTQSDSRPLRSQMAAPPRTLEIVAEEEEESVPSLLETQGPRAGATQNPGGIDKLRSKQTKSKVAQDHQMDTDQAFLTALASRKGKKTGSDEFDQQFDKLRISKPDIRREDEEKAWEILGDFDVDTRNLRGNFMVVMELEVFRRDSDHHRHVARRHDDHRKNYKKFKKTPSSSSRAPIELVGTVEHDYGVGPGYWKDNGTLDEPEAPKQTAETQKRRPLTVLESDGADSDVPVVKPTKKASRKAPQTKASTATKRLFLHSDEEGSGSIAETAGIAVRTEKIDSAPARPNKRRHIIVDDDSDDGVAFKGFGKKKRVR